MMKISCFKTKTKNDAQPEKVLRIDCRGCQNEPDLGNIGCIRCICGSISETCQPERVLLRTGNEEEFSPETVKILREISDVFCRSSAGCTGRKCSQCVLSKDSLEAEKWSDFSLRNIDSIIERLQTVYVECPSGYQCAADARRYFTILRNKLEGISKEAAMTAYKIVGV